ncbi:hypothetical protein [Microbacterium gorillae]|uniref:hypothetical protein n=1 Tax=Microbacterium gorillae TaxID=1231063 RepID=UPI003D975C73
MANLFLDLVRSGQVTEREQRRLDIIARDPAPRFPALETLSDGAGRDVEFEGDAPPRAREHTVTRLTEMERDEAKRIAWDFADGYWSLWRLTLQVIAAGVIAALVGFGTAGIVSAVQLGPRGFVPGLLTAGLAVGTIVGLITLNSRVSRTRRTLGVGAVRWAEHAAAVGAPADISGGWRRITRLVFAAVVALVSLIALIGFIATLVLGSPDISRTSAGVWLCAVSVTALVLATRSLTSSARGLRAGENAGRDPRP